MKTLYSILLLVAAGIFSKLLVVIALNVAGLPGALAAGKPGQRSKRRFLLGAVLSAIGQSYLYLAYVALVVSWTRLAAARPDVIGWLLWPFAIFAALLPILSSLYSAMSEAAEQKYANPQVQALQLTTMVAPLGLIAFIFFPKLITILWAWVPFVT